MANLTATLIRDALPLASADELSAAFIAPAKALLQWIEDGDDDTAPDLAAARVWESVRASDPEATVLPLGSAAERALKRVVSHMARRTDRDRDYAVRRFLETFFFEIAMVDLRGNSADASLDFGFWYHWDGDGKFRALDEERRLRGSIQRQCASAAADAMTSFPKITELDPHELQRIIYRCWRAVTRPAQRRAGRSRLATVIGYKPEEGLSVPDASRAARLVVTHGDGKNVSADYTAIERQSGKPLPPLVADLLDIVATIYLADVHVPREPVTLRRDLVFIIPVRTPAVWQKQAALLGRIVSFLSRNAAEFRFIGANGRASQKSIRVASDERCVSLLSGGLDSFAGATKLIDERQKPYFVSHYPSPPLRVTQAHVRDALLARSPNLIHLPIHVSRAGKGEVDPYDALPDPPKTVLYQHTRSFLFLSLAAAVALTNGIARVAVFENGPVALNPAFSEARFNTRTTHPLFLADFAELIASVFGVELRIESPFFPMTKGEVLASIAAPWHQALKLTNSCWAYARVKVWSKDYAPRGFNGSHCGRCLPCIWRRIAFHAAGIPASMDDAYLWDHVAERDWSRWLDRQHFTVLADQLRFCMNVQQLSDSAAADLSPDFQLPAGSFADRMAMYRRFSRETVAWFTSAAPSMLYRRETTAGTRTTAS